MIFTLDVSEVLGLPNVMFWTTSACGFMGFVHYHQLVEKGLTPLKEQQTNCWYCCTRLGVGKEIDSDVKQDEVAKLVSALMIGEKGKEMKKKAMKLKELAQQVSQHSHRWFIVQKFRQIG